MYETSSKAYDILAGRACSYELSGLTKKRFLIALIKWFNDNFFLTFMVIEFLTKTQKRFTLLTAAHSCNYIIFASEVCLYLECFSITLLAFHYQPPCSLWCLVLIWTETLGEIVRTKIHNNFCLQRSWPIQEAICLSWRALWKWCNRGSTREATRFIT